MKIWFLLLLATFINSILCNIPNKQPKIDIVMRCFERDTPLILMFLRSFEIFFPMDLLGNLFIILDKSKRDFMTASIMPAYAHVVYEEYLPIPVTTVNPHTNTNDQGRLVSQVSNFFSDRYGDAEIIGIVDSDTVFRAPAMHHMLLSNDGKPKLFCSHHRGRHTLGRDAALLIDQKFKQIPYDFSCMENFPFLMWRSSYRTMRSWITKKLHNSNVEQALINLITSKHYLNFFGNFATMGYYLFTYEKAKYHLVVGGNGPYSTCPELRSSLHVFYSMPDWRQHKEKLSWDYFRVASKAIYYGLKLCSNRTSQNKKLKIVYTFLSMEADNEYMFGKPGAFSKAGCEQAFQRELSTYFSSLERWCMENEENYI